MKKIKNWIIKICGGITAEDAESKRHEYEQWAVKKLTGKNLEVTPVDCSIYCPFYEDKVLVIKSGITIINGVVNSLEIAPWCVGVKIIGISMSGSLNHKIKETEK